MKLALAGLLSLLFFVAAAKAAGIDDYKAGLEAQNRRQAEEAIDYFSQAIASGELAGEPLAAAYFHRAQVYLENLNVIRFNKRRPNQFFGEKGLALALADLDLAIRHNRNLGEAFQTRGIVRTGQRQYAAAVSDLNRAQELGQRDAKLFYYRGRSKFEAGNKDQAISDLSAAIEIKKQDMAKWEVRGGRPLSVDIAELLGYLGVRGRAYDKMDANELAKRDYDAIVSIRPDWHSVFEDRGKLLFRMGDFDGAAADFSRHIDLTAVKDPMIVPVALWRHVALRRAGQSSSFSEEIEDAGKASPPPRDKYTICLKNCSRSLDPKYWEISIVQLFLDRIAPEQVMPAVTNDPNMKPHVRKYRISEAYFFLGEHALLRGDRAEAVRMFTATIRTGDQEYDVSRAARAELGRIRH